MSYFLVYRAERLFFLGVMAIAQKKIEQEPTRGIQYWGHQITLNPRQPRLHIIHKICKEGSIFVRALTFWVITCVVWKCLGENLERKRNPYSLTDDLEWSMDDPFYLISYRLFFEIPFILKGCMFMFVNWVVKQLGLFDSFHLLFRRGHIVGMECAGYHHSTPREPEPAACHTRHSKRHLQATAQIQFFRGVSRRFAMIDTIHVEGIIGNWKV